jgi:hemerythrin superfamily protein
MAKRNTETGTRTGSKKKEMSDAIHMLEADHRKVEQLFDEFLNGDAGRRQQVAQEVFRELEVHSRLEEEVFYPALQRGEEPEDPATEASDAMMDDGQDDPDEYETEEVDDELIENTVTSAYQDHRMVKDRITQLRQLDESSAEFRQGMVELQEMVADHVSVEEDELFPQAQTSIDTQALGRRMQERKADLSAAA